MEHKTLDCWWQKDRDIHKRDAFLLNSLHIHCKAKFNSHFYVEITPNYAHFKKKGLHTLNVEYSRKKIRKRKHNENNNARTFFLSTEKTINSYFLQLISEEKFPLANWKKGKQRKRFRTVISIESLI